MFNKMALQNLFLHLTTFCALAGAVPINVRRQDVSLPLTIIEGSTDATELALSQATKVLYLYHSRLGQDGTTALVEPDVVAADAFWHATLANSTGGHVVGKTRIQASAPPAVFNATSIQDWFVAGGTGWPNDFLESSAEHYLSFSAGGTGDEKAMVESIEGWGQGPITYFKGILEEKPEFIPDGSGVEMFQGIWVPDSTPTYVVEGLTRHLTVEFSNWLTLAYKKATTA